jgi:hypothetical protein
MRVRAPCDADLAGTADNVVGHDDVDANASEWKVHASVNSDS